MVAAAANRAYLESLAVHVQVSCHLDARVTSINLMASSGLLTHARPGGPGALMPSEGYARALEGCRVGGSLCTAVLMQRRAVSVTDVVH